MPTWLYITLSLVAAYVVSSLLEWWAHAKLFHGVFPRLGKRWNFHLGEHHLEVRRANGHDGAYDRLFGGWNAHTRENTVLAINALIDLPFALWNPWFYGGTVAMAFLYHYVHRRAHRDPQWCQRWLPWHWEHHMGKSGNANFGVTSCWVDYLMGTRRRFPECFPGGPRVDQPPPATASA